MKATSTRGNDSGSIVATTTVLAILAGFLLVTFSLYASAYARYADRQERLFATEIAQHETH